MKLIGYVTSGYPSVEASFELAEEYLQGGCDMLEISLPLLDNTEAPYLADLMVQAYTACPDYACHLDAIARFTARHPSCPVTLLLYQQVAQHIGAERLAVFCEANGICDVNSPNLTDPTLISVLEHAGIRIAGLVRANFTDEAVEEARDCRGFVYMTAFAPPEKCRPGFETVAQRIAHVKAAGVTAPLYCGGGVRTPEDAVKVRAAGADGVFLGTSILKLQGQHDTLIRRVREFRNAIDAAREGV